MNTFVYDEELDLITGKYNDKLEISELHESICTILNTKAFNSVGKIVKEGSKGLLSLHNDPTLDNSVEMFSRVIGAIKTCNVGSYQLYIERSSIWINKILNSTGELKLVLIDRYLKMLSDFMKVNIFYDSESELHCSFCRTIVQAEDEYCAKCGLQQEKILAINLFISNDLVATPKVSKHPFDKFWNKYLRFQGRTDIIVPKEDIEQITSYIQNNYIITNISESHRNRNVSLIIQVLNKLTMTRHKHDVNLIINIIWNYPLPNYKEFDNAIQTNWKLGQVIIDKYKTSKVTQNITHNNWRLWHELDDVGIEVDVDLFCMNYNKDLLIQMEALWKLRCSGMNRKYNKMSLSL